MSLLSCQAVRDKLLAYADEPFAASGFLLHPHRMERLQVGAALAMLYHPSPSSLPLTKAC